MVDLERRRNLLPLAYEKHAAIDEQTTSNCRAIFPDISDQRCQECQTGKPAAPSVHQTKIRRNLREAGGHARWSRGDWLALGSETGFSDIFPCAYEIQIYFFLSNYLQETRRWASLGMPGRLR